LIQIITATQLKIGLAVETAAIQTRTRLRFLMQKVTDASEDHY
jgi:hypothetical protein